MPNLEKYREKRDPERTPEPFGAERALPPLAPGAPRLFVVQQHDATRMHWDLRLEIEGALASWSIPRGPSLDPQAKRLAVRTEDHPLEYASFEGVIPAGNYGAGAMIVWDSGTYRLLDEVPARESLERGKLDLWLEGQKLRGRFALVHTKGEDGRQWLFFHKGRAGTQGTGDAELVEALPASVFSGLRVDELGAGVSRGDAIAKRARRAKAPAWQGDPAKLRPMLAATGDGAFSRPGWLFELKYDGARVIAVKDDAARHPVRLVSRRGGDVTHKYPEVSEALRHLAIPHCILDGEVVVLGDDGRSSFERLQQRFPLREPAEVARARREHPVVYTAFDLLGAAGRDLRKLPLERRKGLLAEIVPHLGVIRFADHVEGDGEALFAAAGARELEGIVAKKADSVYETGRRSKSWVKLKVPRSAALAIVGIAPGKGSRAELGSLLLAWQRAGALHYAGNAGSGLDGGTIEALLEVAPALEIDAPAFEGAPDKLPRGTRFLRPELVCKVRYTEVTSAGSLRHPVFEGLRPKLGVEECQAPAALQQAEGADEEPAPAPEAQLELTRLDKVFWPVEGYTKGDLLAYYEAAWPWLAPYLEGRPVALQRYPDGIEGKNFYQKNAPDFTPEWAHREHIEGTDYFVCDDLRTLLYVINSGAIPLHVWSARRHALERPDWLILDLDPKQAPFEHVIEIARHVHALLDDSGCANFVKTSGQDGLHVMVPLAGQLDHDQARSLAESMARIVCTELSEIATVARPLAARGQKVYVDALQNGRGRLIAAPFSVRPRAHAPVSTPLRWTQVTRRLDPAKLTIRTALRGMEKRGDPLAGVLGTGIDVAAVLEALTRRLASAEE